MNTPERPRLDRRTAIKWMMTASSALLVTRKSFGAVEPAAAIDTPPTIPPLPPRPGYGTDPDLMKAYKPGDIWPLTLTDSQRKSVSALCDVIIPADKKSPSASAVGVPDFIDEWISAPYPGHERDRVTILSGLYWIEAEAKRRFQRPFTEITTAQAGEICDDICTEPGAKPEFEQASHFFHRFRHLTMGGFYSTREGMADIGYVGNLPSAKFDGPPPEVLQRIGVS